MVGLGCLQVAQRNAVFLQAFAVGERLRDLHAQENDVSWSNARIIGLTSPLRLAQIAEERRLKLVAWLRLPPAPGGVGVASVRSGTVSREHLTQLTMAGEASD
ncbi:MAG: hypothetical protein HYW10_02570 [Candidatus Omnitrophica bacterium]|nr:hypothetical protein [Candidatus Omnitrophota bacterium]